MGAFSLALIVISNSAIGKRFKFTRAYRAYTVDFWLHCLEGNYLVRLRVYSDDFLGPDQHGLVGLEGADGKVLVAVAVHVRAGGQRVAEAAELTVQSQARGSNLLRLFCERKVS